MQQSRGLKSQVVRGVFWSIAEKLGSLLVQLGVGIALLRLLTPSDFGLVGMLTIFSSIGSSIVDSGFSQALIQKQGATERDYNSVFYLNIAIAVGLYLALLALSYPIASLYNTPFLAELAPWIFAILPLSALTLIQTTIFTKQMNFKALSTANFTAAFVSGMLAIFMAFQGYGVWALVAHLLMLHFVRFLLLWGMSSWRPRAEFSLTSIRRLFGLGSQLFAAGIITQTFNNLSGFIIGRYYNSTQLGLYTQSMKLKDSISGSINMSVYNVTFPAFSTLQNDDKKLRDAFHKVVMLLSALLFPVMIGLIGVAEDAFDLIAKEKWGPAVPYVKILSLAALFMPISTIGFNILKAKGRGRLILNLEILKKSVAFGLIVYASTISVLAITWAYFIWMAFEMVVNMIFVNRVVDYKFSSLMSATLPYLAISAVMYLSVIGVGELLSGAVSLPVLLIIKIATGVCCYTLLCWLFRVKALDEALLIVKNIRKERQA